MMSIDSIASFVAHHILSILELTQILITICIPVCIGFSVINGILPIWWRLGKSLAKREIAIIAESETYNNLESVLIDSKLFSRKNIRKIDVNSIGKASSMSLLLAHWRSCKNHISDILSKKSDAAMLIVYAPQEEGVIDGDTLKSINQHRNVIIVNFRGRLINDVFVCMMTSSES